MSASPYLAAIVAAREALGAGDQREAYLILDAVLEDGPSVRRFPCPVCGLGLEFPGLVDAHVRLVHPTLEVAA